MRGVPHVILFDAPARMRHAAYRSADLEDALWFADAAVTVANLAEEIGVEAEAVRCLRLHRGSVPRQKTVVVEGMHRLSMQHQHAAIKALCAIGARFERVVLAGSGAGRRDLGVLDACAGPPHGARTPLLVAMLFGGAIARRPRRGAGTMDLPRHPRPAYVVRDEFGRHGAAS